jgi:adenylate cyclase
MANDEGATLAALRARCKTLIDPKMAEHHGRIVKTTGDGLLVEFSSVVEALHSPAT